MTSVTDYPHESQSSSSRRGLLNACGLGAVGLVSLLAGCGSDSSGSPVAPTLDNDILNFILNLKYLQAEAYTSAATGGALGVSDTSGTGLAGITTGGKKVTFTAPMATIVTECAANELAHVQYLRNLLGPSVVAKPPIRLDALGFGFDNENDFLALARVLEDVSVSAHTGVLSQIHNPSTLAALGQILATDAYHAGNIRLQIATKSVVTKPVDGSGGKDVLPPPTGTKYFATDANGLTTLRSTTEVIAIVRGDKAATGTIPYPNGFFPNGLNGNIG
ncbi:MAG: Dessication-associated protein [Chthonomonadales bacterium]|nr:Dessication-associated protein [Chthonomonadales bacterium]